MAPFTRSATALSVERQSSVMPMAMWCFWSSPTYRSQQYCMPLSEWWTSPSGLSLPVCATAVLRAFSVKKALSGEESDRPAILWEWQSVTRCRQQYPPPCQCRLCRLPTDGLPHQGRSPLPGFSICGNGGWSWWYADGGKAFGKLYPASPGNEDQVPHGMTLPPKILTNNFQPQFQRTARQTSIVYSHKYNTFKVIKGK